MKTIIKKLLSFMLITAFVLSVASCGGKTDDTGENTSNKGSENTSEPISYDDEEDSGNKPWDEDIQPVPDGYIYYGTGSDYKLVVPDNAADEELTAAGEFALFMEEATGYGFTTVKESETSFNSSAKYIYFGKTSAAASVGVSANASEVKNTGYALKTVNKSVFIVGATPIGTLNGTYDLLNYLVDYDCYAYDCCYVKKGVTSVPLYDFDVKFTPTIETSLPYLDVIDRNGMVARRMKCTTTMSSFVMFESRWAHTCDYILPYAQYGAEHPSWYSSDATQWCFSEAYSNEEMFNAVYANLTKEIDAQQGKKYVPISQNDINSWCTCSRCTAMKNKYGSDMAVVIPFLNKVAKKLKADYPTRDLYVQTFSYHKTSAAITYIDNAVMCEPNVTIMFAPIRANYTTGFTNEKNSLTLAALEALSKICTHITAWTYDVHFPAYFVCYESFSGRQDRYQTLSDNNVGFLFEQSMQSTIQSFAVLKAYLTSKLAWNNSLNMDALIKDFAEKYYYNASDTILKYLDSYRTWAQYAYNSLGMHTDINGSNFVNAQYWPKGVLLEWMDMFEQAYRDIEIMKYTDKDAYELALKHVTIESLTPRYLLIQLYGGTYDAAELDAMKRQFRKDCYAYDVAQVKEATSVEELFTNWGI